MSSLDAYFQTPNDIFIHNSFWRDCPILLFLFSFQRFFLARFFRNPWVFLKLFYPRIPAVCYSTTFFSPAHFAFFEQSKIMFLTITKCRTDYFPWVLINNYLAFQRVSFLFSRVKILLLIIPIFYPFFLKHFFLGRSIGVSDASIRINSYSRSLLRRAFFPGSENLPLLIRESSTHRQAR